MKHRLVVALGGQLRCACDASRAADTGRGAGGATVGSGAPVGTGYRWHILASQVVTQLDANSYLTEMIGIKHKLAHKRADKSSWSASERAQRRARTARRPAAPDPHLASARPHTRDPRARSGPDRRCHRAGRRAARAETS